MNQVNSAWRKQMDLNDAQLHASLSYKKYTLAIKNCKQNRGCYTAWKSVKSLAVELADGRLTLEDKDIILERINKWTRIRKSCPHCEHENDKHIKSKAYRRFNKKRAALLKKYGQVPDTPIIIHTP